MGGGRVAWGVRVCVHEVPRRREIHGSTYFECLGTAPVLHDRRNSRVEHSRAVERRIREELSIAVAISGRITAATRVSVSYVYRHVHNG